MRNHQVGGLWVCELVTHLRCDSHYGVQNLICVGCVTSTQGGGGQGNEAAVQGEGGVLAVHCRSGKVT